MAMAPDDQSDVPAGAPGKMTRRLAMGSLAVLVAASGAGFAVRLMMTQGQPTRRVTKPSDTPQAAPTAWVRLAANATPVPAATPDVVRTSGNGQSLRLWHPFGPDTGSEPAAHAAIWNAFTAQAGRTIVATAVPSTPTLNLVLALRGAVAAKDAPDAACLPRLELPGALVAGYLRDLATFAAKDQVDANAYYAHVWDDVHLGAQMSAAPFGADARGLWWRNDFLSGQKIDPASGPATLEELTALGGPPSLDPHKRLTWGFSPFVGEAHPYTWGIPFGARWYDTAVHQFTAIAPASLLAMNWFAGQAKAGTPPAAPGGPSPLVAGDVQALADGQWLVADIPASAVSAFGAAPLPPLSGRPAVASWSSGFGIALPPGGVAADQAWSLAAFYAGGPAALVYVRAGGRRVMPALPALATHPDIVAPGPLWQKFLRLLPGAWARPPIPNAALAWSALAEAADRLRLGTLPVQAVMESVNEVITGSTGIPQ